MEVGYAILPWIGSINCKIFEPVVLDEGKGFALEASPHEFAFGGVLVLHHDAPYDFYFFSFSPNLLFGLNPCIAGSMRKMGRLLGLVIGWKKEKKLYELSRYRGGKICRKPACI